ncbi:MAG: hypothetical protein EBQ65_06680 [Chitinophagaceae bacterium]|nr:hypothetical protein [Chitinophagaceae bacterium]
MKKPLALALFSIGLTHLVCAQQPEKQAGIAVRPVTLEYSLKSLQTGTQKVSITNALNEKKQFVVYVSDWRRDTTGAHVYTEPGKDPRSCAAWIQLSKNFFELNPGETEELIITMNHPADSTRDKQMSWCMLFIETIQEKMITDTIGVTTTITNKFRVGVHVYQNPPGELKKEIKLLSFSQLDTAHRSYRITCQNEGETQLQCASYLEIVSIESGKKIKIEPKEFPLFPEQIRYIDFEMPTQLPVGKYMITAIIDAGLDLALEAAQLQIEIH